MPQSRSYRFVTLVIALYRAAAVAALTQDARPSGCGSLPAQFNWLLPQNSKFIQSTDLDILLCCFPQAPITEDSRMSAISPYGRTKLFQEHMLR